MELIPGLPNDVARECLIRVPYKDFPSIPSVSKAWKYEIESELFHQLRKFNGFSQTVILMAQAEPVTQLPGPAAKYSTPAYWFSSYEPETGTWSKLPAIPGYTTSGIPLFCQCVSVGRSLVVIGGWNPVTWEVSNSLYVYDFVLGTWRRGADMPGPSRSLFACASDGKQTVFIAGGHDQEKNALRSAFNYDMANDKWVQIADMSSQRDECMGLFTGGKFHVIGGYSTDKQGQFGKSSEAFDTAKCVWDIANNFLLKTESCPKTCTAMANGNIYRIISGNVEVLSTDEGWRKIVEAPEDLRIGPRVVAWQDKLFVTGSDKCGGSCNSYVLEFEIVKVNKETCKWKEVEMPCGFSGHVQTGCSLEI